MRYLQNILKLKPLNRLEWFTPIAVLKGTTPIINASKSYMTSQIRYQETQSSFDGSSSSSSINEDEYKKFQRLSQSWWRENGEFEPLHRYNELRVPWIRTALFNNNKESQLKNHDSKALLKEPLLGMKILDVGCGGGILSEPLARLGAQVTAIDMVKENVIVAQTHLNSYTNKSIDSKLVNRIKYVNCALEDLTLAEQNFDYFDGIVMSEVVEHVNNVDVFLQNSSKLLKHNGLAFVTTMNRTYCSYLASIFMAENVLGIVPKGTHEWSKFISPDELSQMLEKYNLFTKNLMGTIYNPLTKQWSWISNTSNNYCLYAQKHVNKV